ncbi:MAG: AAA family ATPase [Burkholderiaceae bacterium]|nr:MAG: AAA family ATPase [Burkholderiaceae bacterium]
MLDKIQAAAAQINQVIVGKPLQIRQALTCLLAGGHLLIEDLPGVGKTTLAHALSLALGLQFKRVQFTNDLLPADLLGVSVYDRSANAFVFHPGPIFSQVLLADEINRATPKTQSALLEAMEEHQVSGDGQTRALPEPFFVIATQNPADHSGTFPLPESQLDRFLMCISLGYPDAKAERALLEGEDRRVMLRQLRVQITAAQLQQAQQGVNQVHCAPALLDYVQALIAHSRASNLFAEGLSPRGALGLLHAARAWAWLDGRSHVLPEDIQAVLPAVAGHRLRAAASSAGTGRLQRHELAAELIRAVRIP